MPETEYNFKLIEKKAQKYWEKNRSFEAEPDTEKEKFYCLSMFPFSQDNVIWDMSGTIQSVM